MYLIDACLIFHEVGFRFTQLQEDHQDPSVGLLKLPENLFFKSHQISKLKCFSSPLAVVFGQSIEARC